MHKTRTICPLEIFLLPYFLPASSCISLLSTIQSSFFFSFPAFPFRISMVERDFTKTSPLPVLIYEIEYTSVHIYENVHNINNFVLTRTPNYSSNKMCFTYQTLFSKCSWIFVFFSFSSLLFLFSMSVPHYYFLTYILLVFSTSI